MTPASSACKLAAAVCRGGGIPALGMGLGGVAAAGLLAGETLLAHARIPKSVADPLPPDGQWTAHGITAVGRPLRFAVLGDSTAAGFGVDDPAHTLAAQLAARVSSAISRPVSVRSVAFVGARSSDLRAQVATLGPDRPDLALVIVGANDVTHRVRIPDATRHLSLAVHRLGLLGTSVVVGTCPDLGTVRPIVEPLRSVVHRQSRALGTAQAVAARRAGAHPVSLHSLLGPAFHRDPGLFGPDRFHPSAAGYALAADVLLPSLLLALGVTAAQPVTHETGHPTAA